MSSRFENERYVRLEGTAVAGDSIVIALPRAPLRPADFWWVIVLLAAVALAQRLRRHLAKREGDPYVARV